MLIVTRFGLGDTVWKVWNGNESYWKPCDFCAETGQISSADGNTMRPCPECYGAKGKKDWRPKAWLVTGPFTIGQVRVQVGGNEEEVYMCCETGVGTGTIHRVADLLDTEAEAHAVCDARNVEAAG